MYREVENQLGLKFHGTTLAYADGVNRMGENTEYLLFAKKG